MDDSDDDEPFFFCDSESSESSESSSESINGETPPFETLTADQIVDLMTQYIDHIDSVIEVSSSLIIFFIIILSVCFELRC